MDTLVFSNNHRRLTNWDYSRNGAYFLTFCTAQRTPSLGRITQTTDNLGTHPVFVPSAIGSACIEAIEELRGKDASFQIDSYVVMPNHVHLLVSIQQESSQGTVWEDKRIQLVQKIVAKVKSSAYQAARREFGMMRVWQRSFHDHIVRNEEELARIREYIENNPLRWTLDRFYEV